MVNKKYYIGMTTRDVEIRWREHLDEIYNRESQQPLYRAMRKYGTYNFVIETIEKCDDSVALERESYWIIHYNSYADGYNATKGGMGKPKEKQQTVQKERKKKVDYQNIFYEFRKCLVVNEVVRRTGHNKITVARAVKYYTGLGTQEYKAKIKTEDNIVDKIIRFLCCVQDEIFGE